MRGTFWGTPIITRIVVFWCLYWDPPPYFRKIPLGYWVLCPTFWLKVNMQKFSLIKGIGGWDHCRSIFSIALLKQAQLDNAHVCTPRSTKLRNLSQFNSEVRAVIIWCAVEAAEPFQVCLCAVALGAQSSDALKS